MTRRRVLAIGLDGYEQSLGDKFMSAGELPSLAALRNKSARFLLDHGPATRTGLAWEHVSTGRSPRDSGHHSAVTLDSERYQAWFDGTTMVPFLASLNASAVVFDLPYFDLNLAPNVRGLVNWGAHDPGVAPGSRPSGLMEEFQSRFGQYPATGSMYDIAWPSPERTRAMGDALLRATEVRARAARWLFEERFPDWDLAFVVASELHSVIEAFWHGIDPTHPLHALPSATLARERLHAVYRATDALVGELVSAFPDATVVAFAMNGMGPNRSDIASMILLPELLHRHTFHKSLLRIPKKWATAPGGTPMLDPNTPWSQAVKTEISQFPEPLDSVRRLAAYVLPEAIKRILRPKDPIPPPSSDGRLRLPLDWMPTSLYQRYWHAMRFFALPSFYDGRVRLNVQGREREGMISPAEYETVCDEVESLVRACRDVRTGEPVVDHVERDSRDPFAIGPTQSDLVVVWGGSTLGFDHPMYGRIGPVPYRRTGGHTGPYGIAYLAHAGLEADDCGVRSSFDVVPTIAELLGEQLPPGFSGKSLFDGARGQASTASAPGGHSI